MMREKAATSTNKARYGGAKEARHSSVEPRLNMRNNNQRMDSSLQQASQTYNRSPMVAGLSYKYAPTKVPQQKKIDRLFPSYGVFDNEITYKTTRKLYDVPNDQLMLEASNNDKLYFKQKFFMKDFMEELLRSNVNPNKRGPS